MFITSRAIALVAAYTKPVLFSIAFAASMCEPADGRSITNWLDSLPNSPNFPPTALRMAYWSNVKSRSWWKISGSVWGVSLRNVRTGQLGLFFALSDGVAIDLCGHYFSLLDVEAPRLAIGTGERDLKR